MGGRGSGSWSRYGSKECLEQALKIDIRYLRRSGMLIPGYHVLTWSRGDDFAYSRASLIVYKNEMVIEYIWSDPETGITRSTNKLIRLSETPCPYGSSRKWLICPRCQHRMMVLVISPPVVGCRHCLDLVYTSQREDFSYRGLRKMNKIASGLDRDEFFGEMLLKPKGMHWRTYYRLVEEYDEADRRILFGMVGKFG